MEDEPPEAPTDLDCCNSGCTYCVFTIYEDRLLKWKNKEKWKNSTSRETRYDLLSATKYKPFVLLMKTSVAHNTYLLRFQPKLVSSDCLSGSLQVIRGVLPYAPGQHFIMKSDSDSSALDALSESEVKGRRDPGKRNSVRQTFVTRAYTPITLSAEENNCCFNIIVKLYEDGEMSKYIRPLNAGDVVYFRGPYGQFNYKANTFKAVVMVCIGTCIAPIYTVIRRILGDDNDETVVKLLYGCRSSKEMLLRDQLREATSYWNFTLKYFISGESANNLSIKFGEQFSFTRISDVDVLTELGSVKSKSSCLVLICGTSDFSKTVSNVCTRYGIIEENIHTF